MKFEVNDDTVLRLSALGRAGLGVHALLAPSEFESTLATEKAGTSNVMTRHLGTHVALHGLSEGVVSFADEDSKDAKKKMLQAGAAAWGVCAVHNLINAQQDLQKKEASYALAAAGAVMTGLCLWRGLQKDEEEEEKTDKK